MSRRIPVLGRLDSKTGEVRMDMHVTPAAGFTYVLNLDGVEQETRSAPNLPREAALEHARILLATAVDSARPRAAYCAVFADEEPLGCWDWSLEEPVYVWRPEE